MNIAFTTIVILIIALTILSTMPDEDNKSLISFEDILVGDTVNIKGEEYQVISYAENGIMEITDGKEKFFINVNDANIGFVLHHSGSKRKYIEIKGLKGTVRGNYLNKIKLK